MSENTLSFCVGADARRRRWKEKEISGPGGGGGAAHSSTVKERALTELRAVGRRRRYRERLQHTHNTAIGKAWEKVQQAPRAYCFFQSTEREKNHFVVPPSVRLLSLPFNNTTRLPSEKKGLVFYPPRAVGREKIQLSWREAIYSQLCLVSVRPSVFLLSGP